MNPNTIVRRVMEKKFPDRTVIVEGPTSHGERLVVSVWILDKHDQSGARFGECVVNTREKAANSEESLNDLWKTRAQLLAAITSVEDIGKLITETMHNLAKNVKYPWSAIDKIKLPPNLQNETPHR